MRVAIYGASGTTGSLIARELADRGAELILAGRDRGKLETLARELDVRAAVAPAPAGDVLALLAAFRGARVVIGCAGPFAELGEPVLEAAIAAGAHYLDISGEQAFLREMYERHEADARRAEVAVISGMAFEIALGDLAAGWAAARLAGQDEEEDDELVRTGELEAVAIDEPLDEVAVTYLVDRLVPTPGRQRSSLAALTAPGVVWRLDRWDPIHPAAERRRVQEREVVSFPSGEVITVPRHVAARRVQTFRSFVESQWMHRAAGVLGAAAPWLARTGLSRRLGGMIDPRIPDAAERAASRFTIVASAKRGFDEEQVTVAGGDVYATTATIAAWGAMELAGRVSGPSGVLAPSEVFAPRAALAALAEEAGLTVTTSF
jgi:short subunit dehydrogenase-like uncharacterized protein